MQKLSNKPTPPCHSKKVVLVGNKFPDQLTEELANNEFQLQHLPNAFTAYVNLLSEVYANKPLPYAILCREDIENNEAYTFLKNLERCNELRGVPSILYSQSRTKEFVKKAKASGADDILVDGRPIGDMLGRIAFLHQTSEDRLDNDNGLNRFPHLKVSFFKRAFDILASGLALLLLSPLFLLIVALIKLESKGPVFYISKRVGTGYRIFNFYKFRSMRVGADKELQKMMHLNQYSGDPKGTSFVKIDNDPRITRFGKFLRNSSLDELPQLINVLLGDMSIVGNRPLPLYEAEKITRDLWSKRFLAPAGITGLWQVTKRGKKEMSTEERIALDMQYADSYSMWFDLKIMAQTFPALLQKESV
jgi:lipopolysaccharide/colanic/teichoic acid biosynthesis glycosyltransferase